MDTNVERPDTLIGERLGPPGHQYEILDLLGRGGMGPVYRAQQLNLPRQVAIKVIDPRLVTDAGFVERFHREAQAIASLEHANILPVYDFGEHEGRLYLVMRLVRGGTVRDRFTREGSRPWPPARVLRLAQQILPALDHAHRAGVIHRDIKPANILLEDDWAYLADFGIAKLTTGAAAPALTLTAAGMMVGTPNYMAPEQVRGQPLDGRADLYAFGVVLYELLTGHVPFQGDTPLEIAIHHLETPLPAARTVNPDVPVTVEAVLMRALAKDREGRYPDGVAFLAALTSAIANLQPGEPTLLAVEGQAPQVTQATPSPLPAATVGGTVAGPLVAGPTIAGATAGPTVAGTIAGPAAAGAAAASAGAPAAAPAAPAAVPEGTMVSPVSSSIPVAGAVAAPAKAPAAAPPGAPATAPAGPAKGAAAPAASAVPAKGAAAQGAVAAAGSAATKLLSDVVYYTVLWALFGSLVVLGVVALGADLAAVQTPDGFGVALRTLALVGGAGVASGTIRYMLGRSAWGGVAWNLAILGVVAVILGLKAAPTLERLVTALRMAAGVALTAAQTPQGRAGALRVVGLAGGAGAVGGLLRRTLARSVWGGLFWAAFWAALAAFIAAGPGGAVAEGISRAAVLGAVGGFLGAAAGRLWVERR